MNKIAKAEAMIEVPAAVVWDALVTPSTIKRYMFGTTVVSDWTQSSPIAWKGEWKGKPYEDKGVIRRIEPERVLQYTHWSPLSGTDDTPDNQHTVTISLTERDGRTRVSLTQDNNPTDEVRDHAARNWQAMLDGLKSVVEGDRHE